MPVEYLKESASQTAGPYVHIGCVPSFAGLKGMYGGKDLGETMITGEAAGERIVIEGHVYDGSGAPLKDALLEIWQPDAAGLFNSPTETRGQADPHFTGWGRQPTDGATGKYRFDTIMPGAVPWPTGQMQAPHCVVWVVARGINLGLNTRVYFDDHAETHATDPVLNKIELAHRRATLVASRDGNTFTFDIHLQGAHETVFFDI